MGIEMTFDKYMSGLYDRFLSCLLAVLIAIVILAPTAFDVPSAQDEAEATAQAVAQYEYQYAKVARK